METTPPHTSLLLAIWTKPPPPRNGRAFPFADPLEDGDREGDTEEPLGLLDLAGSDRRSEGSEWPKEPVEESSVTCPAR